MNALAASFHARFVLPLDSAGRPNPTSTVKLPRRICPSASNCASDWSTRSRGMARLRAMSEARNGPEHSNQPRRISAAQASWLSGIARVVGGVAMGDS